MIIKKLLLSYVLNMLFKIIYFENCVVICLNHNMILKIM
jgi:hypothetical protein